MNWHGRRRARKVARSSTPLHAGLRGESVLLGPRHVTPPWNIRDAIRGSAASLWHVHTPFRLMSRLVWLRSFTWKPLSRVSRP